MSKKQMKTLHDLIKEKRPTLKDNSIRTYCTSIKRIAPERKLDSLEFMQDVDAVLAKIEDIALPTKRSIITAIIVALDATVGKNEAHGRYSDALTQLTLMHAHELGFNKKSAKETDNWTSKDSLIAVAKRMIKDGPGNQRSLIAALYTMQPPTRLDYYDMQIVGKGAELSDTKNYLQVINRNKKTFIFNDYKSSSTYKTVSIPVNKELNKIINKYMKLNPGLTYLLENEKTKGKAMTRNSLGKTIPKLFEATGKHVTLNLIRHIHVSENVDIAKTKAQNQLAKQMMHSTATQLTYAKE